MEKRPRGGKRNERNDPHLGLRKVDEIALVLGEVLRGPLLLLALILEDLDLVFAAEIVAAAAAAHVRHYCGHASDGHRLLPCRVSYSSLADRLVSRGQGEIRLRRSRSRRRVPRRIPSRSGCPSAVISNDSPTTRLDLARTRRYRSRSRITVHIRSIRLGSLNTVRTCVAARVRDRRQLLRSTVATTVRRRAVL